MGVSTDAILFWGYCWEDEIDLLDGKEWVEVVAKNRGIVNPWDLFPNEIEALPYEAKEKRSKEWIEAYRQEIDSYHELKNTIEKEFGCDIRYHCSDSCSIPYICVEASLILARWGYPKVITSLYVVPSWGKQLDRFVAELQIELPENQTPRWWLASYWG